MKTILHQANNNSFCMVEVPEGAEHIAVHRNGYNDPEGDVVWEEPESYSIQYFSKDWPLLEALPPGNWQSVGLAIDLTEQQKEMMVEMVNFKLPPEEDPQLWEDYINTKSACLTSTESFSSLIRHYGLKENTTYILIKEK